MDLKLKDISDLIKIREYVDVAINTFSIDKKKISSLNGMKILIDKRLVDALLSDDFKTFIDFDNVKAAVQEAARITNIKSGMDNTKEQVTVARDVNRSVILPSSK